MMWTGILRTLALTGGIAALMAAAGCSEGAYNDPEAEVSTTPPVNGGIPNDGNGDGNGDGGDGNDTMDCAVFFTQKVQPELEYCRSCHVPEGVADVDDGRGLQFTQNPDDDLDRLYQGWQTLGGNNSQSRILTMASGTDPESHSGGDPWPVDGPVYADVETLLNGFESGWCDAALAAR